MTPRRVRIGGDLYHQQVPAGAVRITRPGRWGNPYRVADHGRDEAIRLFRDYLAVHPELVATARVILAGCDLACWCAEGEPCHGDVWLTVVNEPAPTTE